VQLPLRNGGRGIPVYNHVFCYYLAFGVPLAVLLQNGGRVSQCTTIMPFLTWDIHFQRWDPCSAVGAASSTKQRKVYPSKYLGLARTIYIRCIYGIFGREIIKYTVIYGVYIRFWPTLKYLILYPIFTWGVPLSEFGSSSAVGAASSTERSEGYPSADEPHRRKRRRSCAWKHVIQWHIEQCFEGETL
jgi:hypothetical protein